LPQLNTTLPCPRLTQRRSTSLGNLMRFMPLT